MDFIIALPPIEVDLDSYLNITNKFTKRILILLGKETYIVA